MKKLLILLGILIVTLLSGCNSTEWQVVAVFDDYSLQKANNVEIEVDNFNRGELNLGLSETKEPVEECVDLYTADGKPLVDEDGKKLQECYYDIVGQTYNVLLYDVDYMNEVYRFFSDDETIDFSTGVESIPTDILYELFSQIDDQYFILTEFTLE